MLQSTLPVATPTDHGGKNDTWRTKHRRFELEENISEHRRTVLAAYRIRILTLSNAMIYKLRSSPIPPIACHKPTIPKSSANSLPTKRARLPKPNMTYVATPTTHHGKNNTERHEKQPGKHIENQHERQRTSEAESCYQYPKTTMLPDTKPGN